MQCSRMLVLPRLAARALGWQFVAPPPDRVVIASGVEGGPYNEGAKRWSAVFARDAMRLNALVTAGSV